jgi:hypothetical protein
MLRVKEPADSEIRNVLLYPDDLNPGILKDTTGLKLCLVNIILFWPGLQKTRIGPGNAEI